MLDRSYKPLRPVPDAAGVPEATLANAAALRTELPERVVYRVPGDIDQLLRVDPQRAVDWRTEMREVLGLLMTRRGAIVGDDVAGEGPIAIQTSVMDGPYDATGFATELDEFGNQREFVLAGTERPFMNTAPVKMAVSIELWNVPLTLRSPVYHLVRDIPPARPAVCYCAHQCGADRDRRSADPERPGV